MGPFVVSKLWVPLWFQNYGSLCGFKIMGPFVVSKLWVPLWFQNYGSPCGAACLPDVRPGSEGEAIVSRNEVDRVARTCGGSVQNSIGFRV